MNEILKNPIFATHAVIAAGFSKLATAFGYPFNSLKALVQVGSSCGKQLTGVDVINKVRTLSGSSGYYNGVGWLILGRSLGLGARFGVYEILTVFYKGMISSATSQFINRFASLLNRKSKPRPSRILSDEDIGPLSPLAVSLAAGFSGSPAASASHGSQCIVLPKRGFLKWQLPGKRFESWTGIHPVDRNILFRGLGLHMARSGIAYFVVVGGYLFAIDKLLSE
ncbi:hypothetical protein CQW23_19595 [Capsicum baccatum]|uniref:Uncharacterized protein n=1 Tax=Capsicum baccatum TaxID=33114 RepID=A0A2G2W680_CAPBA|nr:hypothetical protein CQW23_19595 [Capsicum baccatum]